MPIRPEERHRYPPDWSTISAAIRFGRAGGRCECWGDCGFDHRGRCLAVHGDPAPLSGRPVVLTTAHLDHVPENVERGNLRAWCQRCHLAYDAEHHRETRALTAALKDGRLL